MLPGVHDQDVLYKRIYSSRPAENEGAKSTPPVTLKFTTNVPAGWSPLNFQVPNEPPVVQSIRE